VGCHGLFVVALVAVIELREKFRAEGRRPGPPWVCPVYAWGERPVLGRGALWCSPDPG